MNFFKKFSKNLNSKENQELKVNDNEPLENQELKVKISTLIIDFMYFEK